MKKAWSRLQIKFILFLLLEKCGTVLCGFLKPFLLTNVSTNEWCILAFEYGFSPRGAHYATNSRQFDVRALLLLLSIDKSLVSGKEVLNEIQRYVLLEETKS